MAASGHFFHARQSSELLPENLVLKPSNHRRKRSVLSERSASELNSNNGAHPTIRLVDPDSSSPNPVYEKSPFPQLPSQILKPSKPTKHGYTVQQDAASSSLGARLRDRSASPKRSSRLFPQALILKKSNRVSASTTTSNADTLLNDAWYSPTSNRFSTDWTLRNTPTPQEMEEREREREATEALEALEEEEYVSQTIRPVSPSSGSTERALSSSSILHPTVRTIRPSSSSNLVRHPSIESVVALPLADPSQDSNAAHTSSDYSSQQSSSSPDQRLGSYNVIRYATSEDSMTMQYASVRPPTAESQTTERSWSTSDAASLPPLSIARKRLHTHSASAGARFGHGRPLSTIASESEPSSWSRRQSRFSQGSSNVPRQTPSAAQPLRTRSKTLGTVSQYSHSSDSQYETTSSDGSQADLTQFSLMRAQSAVPVPLFSSSPSTPLNARSGDTPPKDNEGEQDDTIAELQARPLRNQRSGHLNRGRSTSDPPPGSSRSNQPSAETDRTSQGSSIFPIWAKQFYRGRTQLNSANASRASLSRSDSQGLSTRSPVRMMPWAHHRRFESGWESYNTGDQSMFSERPPTNRSNFSAFSHSPANSSHFLPSIFRPQSRRRAYTDITAASHSQPSEEFYDDISGSDRSGSEGGSSDGHADHDSLEITPAPPRPGEAHRTHRSSPLSSRTFSNRRQEKQQRRRERERERRRQSRTTRATLSPSQIYPAYSPHLEPSRRLSNRLSAWRAPSFDEALSTLLVSRQNRQILFFSLGFICPLFWMLAAALPIPHPPRRQSGFGDLGIMQGSEETKHEGGSSDVAEEGLSGLGLGIHAQTETQMMDWEAQKGYLKARWWRNLNRWMSVVGVVVIVVVVSVLSPCSHFLFPSFYL